jgi:hypothetical protein
LKPYEFWEMTFVDFLRCIVGASKREAKEWERTRAILSFQLNTQVGKGQQKRPDQLVPLWTDKFSRDRGLTEEKYHEIKRRLAERKERLKKDSNE